MWTWLERLMGKPSMAQMAKELMALLRQSGLEDISFNASMSEITVQKGGSPMVLAGNSPMVLYLGNVFVEYQHLPRSQRRALLQRFVAGTAGMAPQDAAPASYEAARAQLLPIVRTRADEGIALLSVQRVSATGDADKARMAAQPLVGELIVGVAYDTPASMQRITPSQLQGWGVDLARALDDALQNLRALPEHPGWVPLGHGVWHGRWGDGYESSRVLLPDLIHRLDVAEPVGLMPLRNSLLVCSARNETGLALMAERAKQLIDEQPRWLSLTPLQLVSDQWQVFEPPPSCSAAYAELRLQDQAEAYASQKNLLDDWHEREGTDLFVATYSGIRRGEQILSYAVWVEGADSLLPVTDLVALQRASETADPQAQALWVPWAALQEIAGSLMEATDFAPPRYRVARFPDAEQWAALAQHAS